ncbi:MAG TPA: tetratricopeptide repeat protein [Gemmatimonadaceae bacterium]|nr:tetratricopeptide repeat protein [Gemmatimonadaceae bacterium]
MAKTRAQMGNDAIEGGFLAAASGWITRNARLAGAVGVGLLLVGGLVWLWRVSAVRTETRASQELAEAQRVFASGNLPLAESDLRRLVERFGGTKAGAHARLLLAQVLLQSGKREEAISLLRQRGVPEPFRAGYHSTLAAALEDAGRPSEAATEYLEAARYALSDTEADAFRGDAARALVAAGDTAGARGIWAELAAKDWSPIAGEARLRLGELTAKPVSGS